MSFGQKVTLYTAGALIAVTLASTAPAVEPIRDSAGVSDTVIVQGKGNIQEQIELLKEKASSAYQAGDYLESAKFYGQLVKLLETSKEFSIERQRELFTAACNQANSFFKAGDWDSTINSANIAIKVYNAVENEATPWGCIRNADSLRTMDEMGNLLESLQASGEAGRLWEMVAESAEKLGKWDRASSASAYAYNLILENYKQTRDEELLFSMASLSFIAAKSEVKREEPEYAVKLAKRGIDFVNFGTHVGDFDRVGLDGRAQWLLENLEQIVKNPASPDLVGWSDFATKEDWATLIFGWFILGNTTGYTEGCESIGRRLDAIQSLLDSGKYAEAAHDAGLLERTLASKRISKWIAVYRQHDPTIIAKQTDRLQRILDEANRGVGGLAPKDSSGTK